LQRVKQLAVGSEHCLAMLGKPNKTTVLCQPNYSFWIFVGKKSNFFFFFLPNEILKFYYIIALCTLDFHRRKFSQKTQSNRLIPTLKLAIFFSFSLPEMGHLVSWGWNEHGNCGNGSIENVMEPMPVSLRHGRAVLIGGGACHNFCVIDA